MKHLRMRTICTLFVFILVAVALGSAPATATPLTYQFVNTSGESGGFTDTITGTFTYDTTTRLESNELITLAGGIPGQISSTYSVNNGLPIAAGCDVVGACLEVLNQPLQDLAVFFYFQQPLNVATDPLTAVNCDGACGALTNLTGAAEIVTQATPVLPSGSCPSGFPLGPEILACYALAGSSGAWFDPSLASGYTYQMTGGSLFNGILDFPTGFLGAFSVASPGCSIPGTFESGESLDFTALCGQGVSSFTITGIDPAFDPANPGAFPIQLAFNTPTADFVAEPLASAAPAAVPEPATYALMLTGLGLMGISMRWKSVGA